MSKKVIAANQHSELKTLLDKRLLMLFGKGGVGKTVLSAALAQAAQQAGKKVLLAEVRAPHRLPPLFGATVAGDELQQIAPGISWINFTAEQALQIYAMRLLRLRAVYRAVFEQKAVNRFLKAVPSLAEILILGHLHFLIENDTADLIILDGPSTGPGALMLEAPQAVIETSPAGPLRDGAAWIRELLVDRERTSVNLVVLPEELPVSEAIDLFHRLRDGCAVPLGLTLANRVLPNLHPAHSAGLEERIAGHRLGASLGRASRSYRQRQELQQTYLDRLQAGIALPSISLPEVFEHSDLSGPVPKLADAFSQLTRGAP